MNYILYDGNVRNSLLPFTFTRPVADIRIGILTIREKWEKYLGNTTTTVTEEYLADKYPMVEMAENIMINSSFCPNEGLVEMIQFLQPNQAIVKNDEIIAFFSTDEQEEVNFEEYDLLFDMEKDPGEHNNIIKLYPEIADELRTAYMDLPSNEDVRKKMNENWKVYDFMQTAQVPSEELLSQFWIHSSDNAKELPLEK